MNAEYLFEMMTGIDESIILSTAEFLESGKKIRPLTSLGKTLRIVLIAAMLSALLAACGYVVFWASMSWREPKPEDARNYYVTRSVGSWDYARVNHGDCALALNFDTEEAGLAHAFVPDYKADHGLLCTGLTGENSVWEFFKIFSFEDYAKTPVCTQGEALELSGLTEAEAKALYRSAYFVHGDEPECDGIMLRLYDSPQLSQVDLILGWPEGTATIVCEDTWKEYDRLEVIIDRVWDSGRRDVHKHLFLFHPAEQYLIQLSAPDRDFSFKDMERVAEGIELITLDFKYDLKNGKINFSVADYGHG